MARIGSVQVSEFVRQLTGENWSEGAVSHRTASHLGTDERIIESRENIPVQDHDKFFRGLGRFGLRKCLQEYVVPVDLIARQCRMEQIQPRPYVT